MALASLLKCIELHYKIVVFSWTRTLKNAVNIKIIVIYRLFFYGLTYIHTHVKLWNVIFLQFHNKNALRHLTILLKLKGRRKQMWTKQNYNSITISNVFRFFLWIHVAVFLSDYREMNYTVNLCIIFLILLWNKTYAYTKSCERWVSIFNWLRLISAKSYENHFLSIQLVVKTVPNVVMGTDGTLHRRNAYVGCIQ